MKILAGGVRKAGHSRLLAAREARTKMAGDNEAAERPEIHGPCLGGRTTADFEAHIHLTVCKSELFISPLRR